MNDPALTPEQQGDVMPGQCRVCVERGISFVRFVGAAVSAHDRLHDHPFDGVPAEAVFICGPEEMKQQEEPVCAVCGHPEFAQDGSAVHISEREQDGGDDSDDWCVMCANEKRQIEYHPFEPAPPPSRPACARCGHLEAWHGQGSIPLPVPKSGPACVRCMEQGGEDPWHEFDPAPTPSEEAEARWQGRLPPLPLELLLPGNLHGERRAYVEGWIDGRRPIEEERDRLRALYDEACAAMDVLALHSAPRARAEAAEAQVHELRTALAEALTDIKDGWKDSAATVIRRALAARQEEGEAAP